MEPKTRVVYVGQPPRFEGNWNDYKLSCALHEWLTRAPLVVRSVYGDVHQYAMVYREGEPMDVAVRTSDLAAIDENELPEA